MQASSDVITGISSMATRQILLELGATYEQQSGVAVALVAVGGVDAVRRVSEGEAFDFVVLAADVIARLAVAARVDPDSQTDLACSTVAMAVAAGTTPPDVSSEAAIRDAVLRARSVGYSTGPSGTQLLALLDQWRIADVLRPRLVQAPPGAPVATLVARSEVELGFQQRSELLHVDGIAIVDLAPLTSRLQTTFSAAVGAAATRPAAARAWLAFLASPAADAVKRRHGMEVPARPA